MKLLLQSIRRSSYESVSRPTRCLLLVAGGSRYASQAGSPWVCQQCRRQNRILGRFSFQRASDEHYAQFSPRKKNLLLSQLRRASTSGQIARSSKEDEAKPSTSREDLPSHEEGRRSQVSKRFSHIMDNVQSNIFIAGQRLNDLTGYSGIEVLKKDIEEQGSC